MRPRDGVVAEQCMFFQAHYPDSVALVAQLWDLAEWAATAVVLYAQVGEAMGMREEFMPIAEVVRHLRLDPYLPEELLPPNWPYHDLRKRYVECRDDFARRLHKYSTR